MTKSKISFCSFSLAGILFLFLILISLSFYKDQEGMTSTLQSPFMTQIILLGIFFVLISTLIFIYKFKKTDMIQSKVNELTQCIMQENQELKSHSKVDLVTHLANKPYFDERFEQEFKRAIREKLYISIVIVNIDEFKSYNDLYGREEGDKCLKKISEILLEQCSRPSDLVARCHNDEFFILLPNTQNPAVISQKCVEAVEELQIPHDNSIASHVLTISVGTSAILAEDTNQMYTFLSKAQASLKQAKMNGRNRVL